VDFMKASSLLSVLVVLGLASTGSLVAEEKKAPASETAKAKEKLVTPDEAEKLLKENPGVTVLDVRSPEEFAEGHIKGAVNADVNGDDFEKKVAALDQSKPVLVHCQAGRRSARAIEEMGSKVKFPTVYHLNSGFKGWKDAKKPVAK
jgi:phage shock protein E